MVRTFAEGDEVIFKPAYKSDLGDKRCRVVSCPVPEHFMIAFDNGVEFPVPGSWLRPVPALVAMKEAVGEQAMDDQ